MCSSRDSASLAHRDLVGDDPRGRRVGFPEPAILQAKRALARLRRREPPDLDAAGPRVAGALLVARGPFGLQDGRRLLRQRPAVAGGRIARQAYHQLLIAGERHAAAGIRVGDAQGRRRRSLLVQAPRGSTATVAAIRIRAQRSSSWLTFDLSPLELRHDAAGEELERPRRLRVADSAEIDLYRGLELPEDLPVVPELLDDFLGRADQRLAVAQHRLDGRPGDRLHHLAVARVLGRLVARPRADGLA